MWKWNMMWEVKRNTDANHKKLFFIIATFIIFTFYIVSTFTGHSQVTNIELRMFIIIGK